MKLSSVKYLIYEGFKNVWKNWMMSAASIGVLVLCLLLTGASALLSINISNTLSAIESQNVVKVYLKNEVDAEKATQIGESIKSLDNITSCEFYSKEQAVEKFKDTLGKAFEIM